MQRPLWQVAAVTNGIPNASSQTNDVIDIVEYFIETYFQTTLP
jgi:hypothetical protein